RVTQTRTYNANKDRLLSISDNIGGGGGTVITSQGYPDANYDAMDRPKRVNNEDGTFWEYLYNARGEVTSAILKHGTSTLPGWSYSYGYDRSVTGQVNVQANQQPRSCHAIRKGSLPCFSAIERSILPSGRKRFLRPEFRFTCWSHSSLPVGNAFLREKLAYV